ncbi:MAG: GTP 3',8-cyclase MoaA [Lachnospiraceae bacterium]|nr:GTP 3',8-cyclase MoaA [Lachnospiraceae bacterium]
MLRDQYDRKINYMRISITDRCNLRCTYCMPDGICCVPMGELLSYEEITQVCTQAAALGIDRFKVTGGEPLVRKDCSRLIAMIRHIPGVSQVTLTTNGILLGEYLDELLEAGLDAVNISLDTMDRGQYRAITGSDELERVLSSIYLAAQKLPVKINCVVQDGINDNAPEALVMLAKDRNVDVRFIEIMPIGYGRERKGISNTEILHRLEAVYGRAAVDKSVHGNGPAVYYRLDGFSGSIGFISAIHGKFCDSCNRLRLTSTGEIKPCLCYALTIPLKDILRDGQPDQGRRIREKIREAALSKPRMHCFEQPGEITEEKKMAQIGG